MSGDPPADEAGESGCRAGGQVAGAEVPPLWKAWLGVCSRTAVDAADCGSRDSGLNEGAAGSACGADEAKPRSELAPARPGQDEPVHVWIASLPTKRWRRLCSRQRRVELQDAAVVGPAVRVSQRGHSVGGDERT